MAQATVFNRRTGERKVVNAGDPNAFAGGFELETSTNNLNTTAGQQSTSVNTQGGQLEAIMTSTAFKSLNPEMQQLLITIVDSLDPQSAEQVLEKYSIDPSVMEQIFRRAEEQVNPYYADKKSMLDTSYADVLNYSIGTAKNSINRLRNDILQAEESGDSQRAETRRLELKDLTQTLSDLESKKNTEIDRIKSQLSLIKSRINEQLDSTTGDITEDEVRDLRNLQKQYDRDLDTFRNQVGISGLEESSIRDKAETGMAEDLADVKTYTSTVASRRREEAARQARQQTEDVDISAAQGIDDILRSFGINVRTGIQSTERKEGTEAVQGVINPEQQQYLYGGVTGTEPRASRQGTEDIVRSIEQMYGSERAQQFLQDNNLQGYSLVGNLLGTNALQQKESLQNLEQNRRDELSKQQGALQNAYLTGMTA